MRLKSCEFCGTEYNRELTKCPLCGKSEASEVVPVEDPSTGSRRRKRAQKAAQPERMPRWGWAVICCVLGVAVLVGLLVFLVQMGYLGSKKPSEPVSAPVVQEQPQSTPEETPAEQPKEPAEEQPDLSCTGLSLSQTGIVMDQAGGVVYLTATPAPMGCENPVLFMSTDPSVATVDAEGKITAVAPGQTDIIVTCGEITETCTIVCDFEVDTPEEPAEPEETTPEEPEEEEPAPVEPSLSSVDFTLFRPGEETRLAVKNAPSGAVITYISSDPQVASVSGNGIVTAVGSGTATITVMVNDLKLTCVARCKLSETAENNDEEPAAPTGTLQLFNPYGNATDVSLFAAGETFTLSLVDSTNAAVSGVAWSTSNGGVCSVDANGKVTALGGGTATITATYNGASYSCIVRCYM